MAVPALMRRRSKAVGAAAIGVAVVVVLVLGSNLGGDESGFTSNSGVPALAQPSDVAFGRGSPARTGEMPGPAPAGEPTVLWRFGSEEIRFNSGPHLVVDGVVYAGGGGTLHAIDFASGDELWTFVTGTDHVTSPAIADGVVYIDSEDNHLYAVDATSGVERWRFATNNLLPEPPAVVDGTVYVYVHREDPLGEDGTLHALDATSGAERWSNPRPGGVDDSPAIAGGLVYLVAANHLYAHDVETGQVRWGGWPVGISDSPAVAGGLVYIGSKGVSDAGQILAFDALSGEGRWRVEAGNEPLRPSPAVSNEVVYFAAGHTLAENPDILLALEAATGRELWRYEFDSPFSGANSAVVADGGVYVATEDADLYALDARTGIERWRLDNVVDSFAELTVTGGVILATGQDGDLVAFTGTEPIGTETAASGQAGEFRDRTPADHGGGIAQDAVLTMASRALERGKTSTPSLLQARIRSTQPSARRTMRASPCPIAAMRERGRAMLPALRRTPPGRLAHGFHVSA